MRGLHDLIKKIQELLARLPAIELPGPLQKLRDAIAGKKISLDNIKAPLLYLVFVLFVSFTCASAASSLSVALILKVLAPSGHSEMARAAPEIAAIEQPNYHLIKKGIITRNIFNADGEYPVEQDKEKGAGDSAKKFDLNATCNPTTLKITLVGTIMMGNSSSVAVVKEQGVEESDIYHTGDFIIGSETAQIARVGQYEMVLNNAGRKECLYTPGHDSKDAQASLLAAAGAGGAGASDDGGMVTLQASWVESELGEGFSKIMQSARLVPNTEGNKVKGFKIFAIQKDTLFEKIGLRDGDIVVQVNDTVMEAEQGFSLYQTFLEDKDVTIQVLRDGKTPSTLKVRIR